MTRCARRIHHGKIIVCVDCDLRHVGARRAIAQGGKAVIAFVFAIAASHKRQAQQRFQRQQRPQARPIGKNQARAAVAQGIVQFFCCPPGVDEHDRRPDRGNRKNQCQQFGIVAHGNGDTVALAHPQLIAQGMRHAVYGFAKLIIGQRFVFIDQIIQRPVPMPGTAGGHQRRDCRGDVLERFERDPANIGVVDFECRIGSHHVAYGFFGGHRGHVA